MTPWNATEPTWGQTQPATTRCTRCDWTHEGTIQEGTQAHQAHRQEAHGLPATHRRHYRKRGPRTLISHTTPEENLRLARLQGAGHHQESEQP